eukprot:6141714-Alexandrium_andersonii.AAC.2
MHQRMARPRIRGGGASYRRSEQEPRGRGRKPRGGLDAGERPLDRAEGPDASLERAEGPSLLKWAKCPNREAYWRSDPGEWTRGSPRPRRGSGGSLWRGLKALVCYAG